MNANREPQRHRTDTTLIKALAALLVANSHLEHFYPVSWLAGDGLIGNSLFYLLAGYGLACSARAIDRPFGSWMWRRLVRLYPALFVVLVALVLVIGGEWRTWSALQYLREFVWPTRFTFPEFIVPFYVVFFLLLRARQRRLLGTTIVLLIVPYSVVYVRDALAMEPGSPLHLGERSVWVHVITCFQLMCLGGWLAGTRATARRSPLPSGLATITLFALYFAAKVEMVQGHFSRDYAVLHALNFLFCFALFDWLTAERALEPLRAHKWLWKSIGFAGALTLEIYLVHSIIAEYHWLWHIVFPLNLALFWALTLPAAWIVGQIARRIEDALRGEASDRSSSSPLDNASGVEPLVPQASPVQG